jgi:hypothetical protein
MSRFGAIPGGRTTHSGASYTASKATVRNTPVSSRGAEHVGQVVRGVLVLHGLRPLP